MTKTRLEKYAIVLPTHTIKVAKCLLLADRNYFTKVGNTDFTQQNNANYTPPITTYIITLTPNPHVYPRRDSDDDRPARKGPPPKRQQSKPKQKPPQRRKNDSDSDDSYDDDPRVDPRAKAAAALRDLDNG